jgi:hypothetical protein
VLTLVTSLAGALSGLAVGAYFRRRRWFSAIPLWAGVPATAVAVIGCLLISAESSRISYFADVRTWPQTEGVVTDSYVSDDSNLNPQVIFEYSVNGARFIDTSTVRAPGFGGKRKRYDAAEYLVHKYTPGTVLTLSYDPDNPALNELVKHPEWYVYMKAAFGATLVFVGGVLLVLSVARSRVQPGD